MEFKGNKKGGAESTNGLAPPKGTKTEVLSGLAKQAHCWCMPPESTLTETGWGPRGDSGSARGRLRAFQPAYTPATDT